MHLSNWAVSSIFFFIFPQQKSVYDKLNSMLLVTTQIFTFSCIGNTAALAVQSQTCLLGELHLGYTLFCVTKPQ